MPRANEKPLIENVLALRYASAAMAELWSAENKVVLERKLWIAVLKAQAELGAHIPGEAIAAYERVADQVDLASIKAREKITRHDVKARIEEFCELAGYEHIHKGLTSRDLTENTEQLQIKQSLLLLRDRAVAALMRLSKCALAHQALAITGRTHNVPAQVTTLGKRFANTGQELLVGLGALESLIQRYPLRGIKGPVGTQQDMLDLFMGDVHKVAELENKVRAHLGFEHVLNSVGQVYPRSLDFEVVSTVFQLGSAPANFAKTLRLMAGHELMSEGFQAGQVGSSAMPHKMNPRSCERINGLFTVLGGYVAMATGLAGDQWNEGDVSCSVVRRVMLPDTFLAADGLFDTFMTVLDELSIFPRTIEAELNRNLPFLATTKILIAAVRSGIGRELAHEIIREHAVQTARELRDRPGHENDLLHRLANDERLGLSLAELQSIVSNLTEFTGAAAHQVSEFVATVERIAESHAELWGYQPGPVL